MDVKLILATRLRRIHANGKGFRGYLGDPLLRLRPRGVPEVQLRTVPQIRAFDALDAIGRNQQVVVAVPGMIAAEAYRITLGVLFVGLVLRRGRHDVEVAGLERLDARLTLHVVPERESGVGLSGVRVESAPCRWRRDLGCGGGDTPSECRADGDRRTDGECGESSTPARSWSWRRPKRRFPQSRLHVWPLANSGGLRRRVQVAYGGSCGNHLPRSGTVQRWKRANPCPAFGGHQRCSGVVDSTAEVSSKLTKRVTLVNTSHIRHFGN
ncbi:Uncharacterised protein [Mycobacteroides abscessus subsp. abscessus]|nr:Uncharacterised protein [Mycobacteroides abscessus subsp. abscessus]